MKKIVAPVIFLLFMCESANAQAKASVQWITFEQLEESLAEEPRKVFIDFYTDWCTYCRKMDKVVFTKPDVIDKLNKSYYAIRFNAESEQSVDFGSRKFINDQVGKSRNPLHQIAQLFAHRQGKFVAPTLVVLDEDFNVTERYFEYMSSDRLLEILK